METVESEGGAEEEEEESSGQEREPGYQDLKVGKTNTT